MLAGLPVLRGALPRRRGGLGLSGQRRLVRRVGVRADAPKRSLSDLYRRRRATRLRCGLVSADSSRLRVLMISKALVVGAYQRKCEEIAAHPDIDLTVVVPRSWAGQRYEAAFLTGYRTLVEPIRFDGNFHLFFLPTLGRIIREARPDVVHVDE